MLKNEQPVSLGQHIQKGDVLSIEFEKYLNVKSIFCCLCCPEQTAV